jgi:hypothetical protein
MAPVAARPTGLSMRRHGFICWLGTCRMSAPDVRMFIGLFHLIHTRYMDLLHCLFLGLFDVV